MEKRKSTSGDMWSCQASCFKNMQKYCLLFLLFLNYNLSAQQTVGTFINEPEAFQGYTLFQPNSSFTTYLIDNCGRKVHEWTGGGRPGVGIYLLPNGNLLRPIRIQSGIFNAGGVGGRVEIVDWDGALIWQSSFATSTMHQHHDVEPLPNGNILVLAWDFKTDEEAIEAGRDPATLIGGLWSEKVLEIRPTGIDSYDLIWEWNMWDHLVQDFDSTKSNYGIVSEHPELLDINFNADVLVNDWLHCNAIDYSETLDQIVLSSRNMDELFIIDHSTTSAEASSNLGGNSNKGGDLLYRWGNPQNYDRGDASDKQLFGQHNVHWIPDDYEDGGKLMIFNNGAARPGTTNYSTVDIIEPPINSDNSYTISDLTALAPENVSWRYAQNPIEDFFSVNISGAQRLENGNTLICEGASGHFFEINSDNEIVWDYVNPIMGGIPVSQGEAISSNAVFRAERYALDYQAFEGRDLDEGDPIEIGELVLPCLPVAVEENLPFEQFEIYPNPASEVLNIVFENNISVEVELFDAVGQLVLKKNVRGDSEIDVSGFQSGIYFLVIEGNGYGKVVIQ